MVDALVLNLAIIIIIYLSGIDPRQVSEGPRVLLIWVMVPWFYFTALESSSRRGSLGKTMMNIVVTDCDGKRASFGRVGIRNALKIGTLGIGFFLMPFNRRRQALHDMISGSVVIVNTD
tara:strand:+ start:96 stop:452 length:357 start_codon:yes stop_codon:yes gene_type:complete